MRFFEQVHVLVRQIPPGRVASYGQIARMLGQPRAARTVGWALRAVSDESGIPWQRVLNSAGRVSLSGPQGVSEQRRLLEAEGVVFEGDCVNLKHYGWEGLAWPEIQELLAEAEAENEQT
jgi:methylated-DNA-protein-cysteine methyltransferase-like protein